ncbi:MAG: hypothetical protein N3F66_04995 [Spirochaetes bacterium]|nr:hypothetical protein [Spirochaetota bacterium]
MNKIILPSVIAILLLGVLYANDAIIIKSGCLRATINAITFELKNYQAKCKVAKQAGDIKTTEKMKKRIAQCNDDLKRFTSMSADNYLLPDISTNTEKQKLFELDKTFGPLMPPVKKEVTITFKEKCREGALLEIDGITRSGPFYHVAGIVNNSYDNLEVGRHYKLIIYLVYKKEYFGFIPNYYVYISHYEAI